MGGSHPLPYPASGGSHPAPFYRMEQGELAGVGLEMEVGGLEMEVGGLEMEVEMGGLEIGRAHV